jgi:hypothetical protein
MLDHPNGATALAALWIAADDPAEPAARYARFTGRDARRDGAVTTIALDRGALHFIAPAHLGAALGIAQRGKLPCLAAAEIAVADLAIAAACVVHSGLAHRRIGDRIVVALPPGLGDALVFRED